MRITEMVKPTEESVLKALPKDESNLRRLRNLHPDHYQNPKPAAVYNMVVIGGGSAGLITAIVAAGLGGKVALVEKHLMGGDCLNVGCVPSKALLRSAKTMGEIMNAQHYGVISHGAQVDFEAVMARVRRVQAQISPNDSVWRYRDAGVDVFLGEGSFTSRNTIEVAGATLKFKKAVIATGSRPAHPPIPGLAEAGYLTNETVFNLTEQPKRIAIIGGGPIGCELAQAFRRLGSEVTLFHKAGQILPREDADAAEIVEQAFLREGIKLALNSKITQVAAQGNEKIVHFEVAQAQQAVIVDEIIVAAGRVPSIDNLGLVTVGVQSDPEKGIIVNDYLQTTNPAIYAAGDVALASKFTHAANASARIVVQNAFFFGRKKLSALKMPWCTYTDPEIAHVGLSEREAKEQSIKIDTYIVHFNDNDRAVTDGEEAGFVKVHTAKGSDKILGATIVARAAGEMLNEITLAMVAGTGLQTIGDVIHPYPTQAEAITRVAGLYTRTRLTAPIKILFSSWMKLSRR